MMPVPSGPGLLIAFVVFGLLVLAGLIAIIAAVNELIARLLGPEIGCLLGGLVGLAWLWFLSRIDHLGLAAYTAAFLAGPVILVGLAVLTRRRWGPVPQR